MENIIRFISGSELIFVTQKKTFICKSYRGHSKYRNPISQKKTKGKHDQEAKRGKCVQFCHLVVYVTPTTPLTLAVASQPSW